jgi:phosphoribosylaminoimidazole-succinocarboxamide synthase
MNSIVDREKIEFALYHRGKVRDVYDLDKQLLIVATDRVSAFDYVLPTLIPDKGKILHKITMFWFDFFQSYIPNHVITGEFNSFPPKLKQYSSLKGRSMLVKKAKRIDIECVVRGYLAGSGWKEYQASGEVCGIKLPEGLKESSALPEPIFTPSTKAEDGEHDQNISFGQSVDIVGKGTAQEIKEKSLYIYTKANEYARSKGIIIADTKFEFGVIDNRIILIDEILTPDSSRFWEKKKYKVGGPQDSLDKQYVRDYLESIKWNKQPPVPALPKEVVEKTREKYLGALKKLTGKGL